MISSLTLLAAADPMQHVLPHRIFKLAEFDFDTWSAGPLTLTGYIPFTNHMLMLVITAVIMLLVFPPLARNYPMVPSGVRNFFETGMEFVREGIARPSLHDHTDRFMPFLWTLFFFILINNLLGLVPLDPILLLVSGKGHVFGTATGGLSVTAGLALVAFIMIHVSGILQQYEQQRHHGKGIVPAAVVGFFMYWHSFVPHIPGVTGIVLFPFLFVLELVGAVVKPFALAIRLFANMMAGHVVLASLLIMAPVIKSVADFGVAVPTVVGCAALSCLELFVAFLQAYIFVFLTCMFIGAAVSPEH